jgi:hypothetical protein
MIHEVNIPETLAEVTLAFERYEQALTSNDVAVLDELFWNSPHTLRYGATENLYGHATIAAFRGARSRRIGRQSQTWMRTAQGWRVVAGHVSLLDKAG